MTLLAYVFFKLKIVKCMFKQMSKQPLFIAPFYCQNIKWYQKAFEISMRVPLPNYFVILRETVLENLSVSDI